MSPPPDPSAMLAELAALGEKLAAGAHTLPAAEPGVDGVTARDPIAELPAGTLFRYRRRAPGASGTPLLVVFAMVNRPWVLDLEPGRSTVRQLLENGLDVHLLEWREPRGYDPGYDLGACLAGGIGAAIEAIGERHGGAPVDLLGVCQGGTLALCQAALEPARVRRLVTMVTPVDFHTDDNLLARWVRHVDVDALVDAVGNVPGALLNGLFAALRPMRHTGRKHLELVDALDDPARLATFVRMERWAQDSPAQPGEVFREFARLFFRDNALATGGARIGARTADLARLTMPLLNVYATRDHIVPPSASIPLERLAGSRAYTALPFDGGHIGIYVSRRAQDEVAPAIARWLKAPA